MIYLSVLMFISGLFLFIAIWRRQTPATMVTPLLIFVLFEVSGVWPATVYDQTTETTDWYAAVLTFGAFLAFLAGFVSGSRLTQATRKLIADYGKMPLRSAGSDGAYLRVLVVLTVVLTLLSNYLYQGRPLLVEAITSFLRGDTQLEIVTMLSAQREELTKGYYFGEAYKGQGLILQILQIGWPYVTLVAAGLAYATRRRLWWIAAAALMLLSFVYVGAAARYQLVQVLLTFLIGLSLFIQFNFRRIVMSAMALAVLVLAVAPLSMQTAEIDLEGGAFSEMAAAMRDRILLGDGVHNLEVIRFTEDGSLPYGYGRYHLEKALTALPGITVGIPLSQQLQALRTGNPTDTSFASMTYLGVLYADFGAFGPVLGYLLIGLFIGWLHGYLFRRKKTVLQIPMIALAIISVGGFTIGSSVSAIATFAVIAAFHAFALMLFYLLRGTAPASAQAQAGRSAAGDAPRLRRI